jgi:hypothetical protein
MQPHFPLLLLLTTTAVRAIDEDALGDLLTFVMHEARDFTTKVGQCHTVRMVDPETGMPLDHLLAVRNDPTWKAMMVEQLGLLAQLRVRFLLAGFGPDAGEPKACVCHEDRVNDNDCTQPVCYEAQPVIGVCRDGVFGAAEDEDYPLAHSPAPMASWEPFNISLGAGLVIIAWILIIGSVIIARCKQQPPPPART